MIQWYYADATHARQGPIDAGELVRLRLARQLDWDTLVWREGMDEWRPMREFAAELAQADAHAPLLSTSTGEALSSSPSAPDPARSAPGASRPHTPAPPADGPAAGGDLVVPAGILRRYAALVIDNLILLAVFYAAFLAILVLGGLGGLMTLSGSTGIGLGLFAAILLGYLSYPVLSCLYFVLMESSPRQATLGKLALGIKVVDAQGGRLGRRHALGRWAAHLVCYFTLNIGYLMAAFTERRQALHDMVTSTQVVDGWAYTRHPERQRSEPGVLAWALVAIGTGLLLLGLAGVVAALVAPGFSP